MNALHASFGLDRAEIEGHTAVINRCDRIDYRPAARLPSRGIGWAAVKQQNRLFQMRLGGLGAVPPAMGHQVSPLHDPAKARAPTFVSRR